MNTEALDSFQLDLGTGAENLMALSLALMMFAVALGLRPENFRFFKDQPRIYFGGVIAQLLLLPLLTLALCFLFKPVPSIALGMILVACCPGGNVSNILSLFGRANTALSVSLTATSSLAAAFFTPIAILFWSSLYPPTRTLLTEIDLDKAQFLIQTLLILALPLILGMIMVKLAPALSARLQKPLAAIGGLALLGIIIMACIKFLGPLFDIGPLLIGIVIVHNTLALGLGYITGLVTKADKASRRALTFEVGIQNSGLGIVILLTQLGGLGGAGAIAGLWGTWHIISGLTVVALFRYNDRRTQTI